MHGSFDEIYLLNSKNLLFGKKNKKAHQFHYDENVLYLTKKSYTTLYNAMEIKLPDPNQSKLKDKNFLEVILKRESIRNYSNKAISLQDLSTLLYFSAGTRENKTQRKRNVPTGGNLNSTDIYFFSMNVEGLEKGLYYYNFINHTLNPVFISDFEREIKKNIIYQPELASCPLLIIFVANMERVKSKYGMRALRIVHIDCGALMQNLYLVSEVLNLGSCAIGGVVEHKIELILDINGIDQFVLLAHSIGHKQ
ncbi:MAG: SagB/ThcOx family dehydrogenase [Calditrichaceae bacterium]